MFKIDQLTPMRFYDVSVVFTTELGNSQATKVGIYSFHTGFILIEYKNLNNFINSQ